MKRMIFLISILFLAGCQTVEPLTYDDVDHLQTWSEIDGVERGTVYVYYYSTYCSACQSISEQVLSYAGSHPDIPIYFMVSDDYRFQGSPPTTIKSIPSLLVFEDREFERMITGAQSVVNQLQSN
jgi:thiol-disulfide isomerase/thioredoxin